MGGIHLKRITTLLLAGLCSVASAGGAGQGGLPHLAQLPGAGVIEMVTFNALGNVPQADMVGLARDVGAVLQAQPGFVARYFSRAKSGQYLIVNFWKDAASIEKGNPIASSAPESARMFPKLDMQTVKLSQYAIRTPTRQPLRLSAANVIEIVTYSGLPDTSEADILPLVNASGNDLYRQKGFLGRYAASDGKNNWLIVNFWRDQASVEAGNKVAANVPSAFALFNKINMQGVFLDQFAIQTRP